MGRIAENIKGSHRSRNSQGVEEAFSGDRYSQTLADCAPVLGEWIPVSVFMVVKPQSQASKYNENNSYNMKSNNNNNNKKME